MPAFPTPVLTGAFAPLDLGLGLLLLAVLLAIAGFTYTALGRRGGYPREGVPLSPVAAGV